MISPSDFWQAGNAAVELLARHMAAKASSAIDGMIRGYLDDLNREFLDVLDGNTSTPAAARAHRLSIELLAEPAYDAGMEDGGADPDEKDDIDEAAISDWQSEQDSHVDDLWADVKQLRKDRPDLGPDDYAARQLIINNRLGQWSESLRNLYSLGKANAQKNKSVTWNYGDTDHCDTCDGLNGQRHRLKWFLDRGYIPQQNGSQTLDCHGYHCQCTLDADDGEQVMP